MFDEQAAPVTIALRIPGKWSEPKELVQRLPEGFRLTGEELIMPDGVKIEFGALPPDDQFADIFRSSCRNTPTDDELAAVGAYQVNLTLSGPGGSIDSARTMMMAASSLIRAGGAGVFIDNSGVAHGGRQWLELTDDGGPDALSFAFVAIVGSDAEIYTMGMHALGQREIVMKRARRRKRLRHHRRDPLPLRKRQAGRRRSYHRRPKWPALSGRRARGLFRPPSRQSLLQPVRPTETCQFQGHRGKELIVRH